MTAIKMNEKADYGNWVPMAMMKMMWGTSIGLCVVTIALFALLHTKIPGVIALLVTLASLCMTIYMTRCRQLFAFNGGGVMGDAVIVGFLQSCGIDVDVVGIVDSVGIEHDGL